MQKAGSTVDSILDRRQPAMLLPVSSNVIPETHFTGYKTPLNVDGRVLQKAFLIEIPKKTDWGEAKIIIVNY
jgi:hypothetical protein